MRIYCTRLFPESSMRSWCLLSSLFLLSLVSLAQQSPSNQNTANDASAGSGEAKTVVGCVSGLNGSFTLATASGDVYRLKGHHGALFGYNGKEVRITGTVASSDGAPQTLNISKIKKVYDTCQ
jgi:hypothetical protein